MLIDQFLNSGKSGGKSVSEEVRNSEKPVRSILKSVSWRIIGTLDTIVISWIITGEVSLALTIGSIELITKMVLYFFHERIWNFINWGKK